MSDGNIYFSLNEIVGSWNGFENIYGMDIGIESVFKIRQTKNFKVIKTLIIYYRSCWYFFSKSTYYIIIIFFKYILQDDRCA